MSMNIYEYEYESPCSERVKFLSFLFSFIMAKALCDTMEPVFKEAKRQTNLPQS